MNDTLLNPKSGVIRIPGDAYSRVVALAQESGVPASRVAGMLIVDAADRPGSAVVEALRREAEARACLAAAQAKAAEIRRGSQ